MEQGRLPRIIYTAIGAIIVMAIIFIAIWGIGQLFSSDKPRPTLKTIRLSDYASSDAKVSYTQEGIINGEESHRTVIITIGNTSRKIEQVDGYQGRVVRAQSYSNNSEAYSAFLASLQKNGYLMKRSEGNKTIEGSCAQGSKYIFTTSGIEGVPEKLWTTSCGTISGTAAGNIYAIRQLYQLQIPDYDKFISSVSFYLD
jgi:hypothetical protein